MFDKNKMRIDTIETEIRRVAGKYNDSLQPYYLEIWIGKNTYNYILDPICEKYHVNLIPLKGESSNI